MKVGIEVSEIKIDIPKIVSKVRSDKFMLYAAQQWHRLYYKYVPFATGTLADSVKITPGEIEHYAIYARYQYNGNFNFRRDQHPLASRHWDKAAEPAQKPQLIAELQAYVDSGRLDFD